MNVSVLKYLIGAIMLLFAPLLLPCIAAAQDEPVYIRWDAERKLAQTDFRPAIDSARPVYGSSKKMSSMLDLCYYVRPFAKGDAMTSYDIYPVFYSKSSWLADTSFLKHEQCHFDIAELYARRMRRYLQAIKATGPTYRTVQEELKTLYEEHAAIQKRYDRETNYGTFRNMQIYWNTRTAATLDTTETYSRPTGSILVK